MLIDWFTVAAQIVNFLILMWLLKRFLYKPVLKAIDDREARIAETVRKAEEERQAAEAEHASLQSRNEAFEVERSRLLAQAREEAREEGKRLLAKEREDAEDAREKWRAGLAAEQRRFGDEVGERVRNEVFALLRQAFGDLADEDLEDRMAEVFARRAREAGDTLAGMAAAAREDASPFLVKTAFELSGDRRETLRQAVLRALPPGTDADVRFQTDPKLIGGVELIAGGKKLVWTLGDYLGRVEGTISGMLDVPASAASRAEPAARSAKAGGTAVIPAPGRGGPR